MRGFSLPLVAALLAAASTAFAQPLSTAFTYQGELHQSGAPATGTFDLQFKLFTAVTAGTQVGSTLCADNVVITGGRFTQTLDFGAAFAGQKRFIEVSIRADAAGSTPCSNAAGYTTLAPRQELTAAPNAIFALNSTNSTQLNGQAAAFYQNASNLNAGSLPASLLGGTYSNAISLSNTSNTFSGSGAGLTALNASNLSSGTIPDTRLSANIPRLDAPNIFGDTVAMHGFQLITGVPHLGDVLTADDLGVGTWQPLRLQLPYEATAAIPFPGCTFSITSSSLATAICGYNTSLGGPTIGIQGGSSSPAGTGIVGTGATGVRGEATFPGGFGVYGYSVSGTGVQGLGDVGIRGESTNPNGNGVVGYANGGNDAWAVSGETVTGQAVIGRAGNAPPGGGFPPSTGIVGYSNIGGGFTQGIGVYGEAASPTGLTFGGDFRNASISGTAVRGWASNFAGQTFGGDFYTGGDNFATAVRGEAGSTSGSTIGGDFTANSSDAYGVRGRTTATSGFTYGGHFRSNSTQGKGVLGWATSPTGANYGVQGITSSSDPNAWGVFATGRLGASGTKSFRIDHPQDPDHKYLLHYSSESPEVLNTYSGKVMLDSKGEATVELPAYFASINMDPRYTLTPVGAPMPMLHIAIEIDEATLTRAAADQSATACSFRIGGGAPGGKVSWRIEAVRNDQWVREHGAPVELQKQAQEPEITPQPPRPARPD